MEDKKVRNIKVIEQSGYKYKATPTIILKGQWLNGTRFQIGDQLKVECEDGRLVISVDKERVDEQDVEQAFVGIKKIVARYEQEKEKVIVNSEGNERGQTTAETYAG